jgi:hypothetical protein
VATIMLACNNETKQNAEVDSPAVAAEQSLAVPTPSAMESGTSCYAWIKNRDTVDMKLNVDGEEVTGQLNYRWYEKDKSLGTFSGEMNGDTLIAEYIFDSEGMRSVREIVFLKKDNKFYQGTGEMAEKGSKVMFLDKSKLDFSNDIVLDATDCK